MFFKLLLHSCSISRYSTEDAAVNGAGEESLVGNHVTAPDDAPEGSEGSLLDAKNQLGGYAQLLHVRSELIAVM